MVGFRACHQGYFLPPHYGGETGFRELFPPIIRDPGGEVPPHYLGKFWCFPPFWGVFAHFSGFWGYFPPIIWDPGGEVKNRFPPIMGGKRRPLAKPFNAQWKWVDSGGFSPHYGGRMEISGFFSPHISGVRGENRLFFSPHYSGVRGENKQDSPPNMRGESLPVGKC